MTTIFNDYLTGEERALAIEEATIENQLDKLFAMVEMVDMNYAMNCRDAELKVLTESGTYDDLGALYEAAAEDQKEKKEGLLAKIGEGIKNLIDFIKTQITNFCNWITGKSRSENTPPPEEKYEMPKCFKTGSEAISKVQSLFANAVNQLKTNKTLQVGTLISGIGIIGLIGKIKFDNSTSDTVLQSKLEIDEIMKSNLNALDKFKGLLSVADLLIGETKNAFLAELKKACNTIKEFVGKSTSFIMKNGAAAANSVETATKGATNAAKNAGDTAQKATKSEETPAADDQKQGEQVEQSSANYDLTDGETYSESSYDELISLIDSL